MRGRPNDVRGFVHKRIFGAVKGFVTGGPIGAASGFVSSGGSTSRQTIVQQAPQACPPNFHRSGNTCVPSFTAFAQDCPAGTIPDGRGGCMSADPRARPPSQDGFGGAVMGPMGMAGLTPQIRSTATRICPRGAVLGMDGLCYNRSSLRNSDRMWPRGRRPLLTGGEMRCISVAASAGRKLQRKVKQLQSMGMMKRPAARGRRQLAAGHHAHVAHD